LGYAAAGRAWTAPACKPQAESGAVDRFEAREYGTCDLLIGLHTFASAAVVLLDHGDWRSRLRRDIGWLLLVKFACLAVLWAVFFSGSHRCRVDASAAADRLAVVDRWAAPLTIDTPGGDRCD